MKLFQTLPLSSTLILLALVISPCLAVSSQISPENAAFLEQQIEKCHLVVPQHLFSYCYNVEIRNRLADTSFELDPAIISYAEKKHAQLNSSPYFDIKFVLQPPKVRKLQTKKKIYSPDVGTLLSFTATDGSRVEATYFDRKSDTLVIIGPGFTNEREKLAPFTHIFSDYDLVFFDYRGHGIKDSRTLDPTTWQFNIVNKLFGVDTKKARLGLVEELDVEAVVEGMKARKSYAKVVGVGVCYSAMIFIKAASLYNHLFTHLIVDGCWYSLENFTNALSHDIKMLCSPQRGGWKSFWLTSQTWGRDMIKSITESLFGLKFQSIAVLDYLPHLPKDLNMLFVHGKNDLVISRSEFEKIYISTPCHHKTAVITSNPHVWNHLKQKELYKLMSNLFVNLPYKQFSACLADRVLLAELQTEQLKSIMGLSK